MTLGIREDRMDLMPIPNGVFPSIGSVLSLDRHPVGNVDLTSTLGIWSFLSFFFLFAAKGFLDILLMHKWTYTLPFLGSQRFCPPNWTRSSLFGGRA